MDFSAYLSARNTVQFLGEPLFTTVFLLALISCVLSVLYLYKKEERYEKMSFLISLACVFLLTIGFILLIYFHIKIHQTIDLQNPFSNEIVGKYWIPLWINEEKLYFWMFCFAIIMILIWKSKREMKEFNVSLNLIFGVYVFVCFFFSNPFKSPLSQFHEEISLWNSALAALKTGQLAHLYVLAQLFESMYGRMVYYYNTSYMWIHPPLLFFSYAAFTVTFLACISMLLKKDDTYENLAYFITKIGYLPLTFGILIGYPWAVVAWQNEPWWWAPKINASILMWILYTSFLHLRIYVREKKIWNLTAYLGIICFITLIFTYLVTYLGVGAHAYR